MKASKKKKEDYKNTVFAWLVLASMIMGTILITEGFIYETIEPSFILTILGVILIFGLVPGIIDFPRAHVFPVEKQIYKISIVVNVVLILSALSIFHKEFFDLIHYASDNNNLFGMRIRKRISGPVILQYPVFYLVLIEYIVWNAVTELIIYFGQDIKLKRKLKKIRNGKKSQPR